MLRNVRLLATQMLFLFFGIGIAQAQVEQVAADANPQVREFLAQQIRRNGSHVAYSGDGKTLAWTKPGKSVMTAPSAQPGKGRPLAPAPGNVLDLAVSPRGDRVAVALAGKNAQLLAPPFDKKSRIFPIEALTVRYTESGNSILAVGKRGAIQKLDPNTGKVSQVSLPKIGIVIGKNLAPDVARKLGSFGRPLFARFNPSGTHAVIGLDDG